MDKPLVILAYPKIDHEKDYVYFWMPFSVLTIAKTLIEDDREVIIFDGNRATYADWDAFLDRHIERAVCIGISIMTGGGQIGHALRLAKLAKAKKSCPPLIFGGPHVNVLAEQTVKHPLVDAVLVGPGQTSMPAFVAALMGQRDLTTVPGLMTYENSMIISGPDNPPRTSQLGRYPWHLLSVEDYIRDDPTVASETLNYVSSQGCVYECRFCYELTYKRKYSAITANDLVDDIETLQKKFGISGVKFYDADFFINLKRVAGFLRGLLERNIHLKWAASINPNDILKARRLEPELLSLMAQGGCTRLLMGVESGSDRVLRDVVQKEVTRAQIIDVASEIAGHGILGSYTFIIGFPGETEAEQEETFDLIGELRKLDPTPETRVHIFAPYPGTPLYEKAIEHGFVPPDNLEGWSRYDYYESQTPWTNSEMAKKARDYTLMRLHPKTQEEVR
jgi:radical SAM superfamily enzyme YgiQ (UPF0313 family)